MGDPLSREEAREIVLLIHCVIRTLRETTPLLMAQEYAAKEVRPLYELEGRALKLFSRLSQPQNLGSTQE